MGVLFMHWAQRVNPYTAGGESAGLHLNGFTGRPRVSHTFTSIMEILEPTSKIASNGTKFKYTRVSGSRPVLAHPLGSVFLLLKCPFPELKFQFPSCW